MGSTVSRSQGLGLGTLGFRDLVFNIGVQGLGLRFRVYGLGFGEFRV